MIPLTFELEIQPFSEPINADVVELFNMQLSYPPIFIDELEQQVQLCVEKPTIEFDDSLSNKSHPPNIAEL